jgi:hypothetical protein
MVYPARTIQAINGCISITSLAGQGHKQQSGTPVGQASMNWMTRSTGSTQKTVMSLVRAAGLS